MKIASYHKSPPSSGRIVGVDEAEEYEHGPNTKLVDLRGRRVIPGLNDSHRYGKKAVERIPPVRNARTWCARRGGCRRHARREL